MFFGLSVFAEIDWKSAGMVDVQVVDPSLKVELPYTTTSNFTGKILYKNIDKAYLRPEVAAMLVEAQRLLKAKNPAYCLLVYDAARPFSVQKEMWEIVKDTPQRDYVANPNKGGGLHNYGAAVDVTIVDVNGRPLSMGTGFDHFGPEAEIHSEKQLLKEGKITQADINNRQLLRDVMVGAGFQTISNEWWHFNAYTREYAQKNLPLVP